MEAKFGISYKIRSFLGYSFQQTHPYAITFGQTDSYFGVSHFFLFVNIAQTTMLVCIYIYFTIVIFGMSKMS